MQGKQMKSEPSAKSVVKLITVLLLSAILVLVTFIFTQGSIAKQGERSSQALRRQVLAAEDYYRVDLDALKNLPDYLLDYDAVTEVYQARNGSEVIGYTVRLTTQGYGGKIDLLTGIKADGSIAGVRILSHSETPGLGAQAQRPDFLSQYTGKAADGALEVYKNTGYAPEVQPPQTSTFPSSPVQATDLSQPAATETAPLTPIPSMTATPKPRKTPTATPTPYEDGEENEGLLTDGTLWEKSVAVLSNISLLSLNNDPYQISVVSGASPTKKPRPKPSPAPTPKPSLAQTPTPLPTPSASSSLPASPTATDSPLPSPSPTEPEVNPGSEVIQAISGATITSQAVTDGVNLAADLYLSLLAGNNVPLVGVSQPSSVSPSLSPSTSASTAGTVLDMAALRQATGYIPAFESVSGVTILQTASGKDFVVDVNVSGRNGPIAVKVTINANGTIAGVEIGKNSETPRYLGAVTSDLLPQLNGKSADGKLKSVLQPQAISGATTRAPTPRPLKNNEVEAVSGATETSKSVVDAVNLAGQFYQAILSKL